jgi:hypothetical protein
MSCVYPSLNVACYCNLRLYAAFAEKNAAGSRKQFQTELHGLVLQPHVAVNIATCICHHLADFLKNSKNMIEGETLPFGQTPLKLHNKDGFI